MTRQRRKRNNYACVRRDVMVNLICSIDDETTDERIDELIDNRIDEPIDNRIDEPIDEMLAYPIDELLDNPIHYRRELEWGHDNGSFRQEEAVLVEDVEMREESDENERDAENFDWVEVDDIEDPLLHLDTSETGLLYYLCSTTQSTSATDLFFQFHRSPHSGMMQKWMGTDNHLITVKFCGVCAQDIPKCRCTLPCSAEVSYSDPTSVLKSLMDLVGSSVITTQDKILRGEPSSSPMCRSKLRSLLDDVIYPEVRVHFAVCFDGVRPKGNCRRQCWIMTAIPLDLEDTSREQIRCVMPLVVYIADKDPNFLVHDRIVKMVSASLAVPFEWHGLLVSGKIAVATYDDPAKRKVFNLLGYSSAGSCPFCYSQGTYHKHCDANTVARTSGPAPPGLRDGLKVKGAFCWFNQLMPMHETPIDLFHLFHEGILPLLTTETFGTPSLPIFGCVPDVGMGQIKLPSQCGEYRFASRERTGSEKAWIFETTVVYHSFCGRVPAIGAAIVLVVHAVYRSQVDPRSAKDMNIHHVVRALLEALLPLIMDHCPQWISGPKRHQFLYHLADNVEMYGPLGPVSTRCHEHAFHVLQRNLCPEISNGLGKALLNNSIRLHQLISVVIKKYRHEAIKFGTPSAELQLLATRLSLLPKARRPPRWMPPPVEFANLVRDGDAYCEVMYIEGRRYSVHCSSKSDNTRVHFVYKETVQYAQICGFLNDTRQRKTVLLRPFVLCTGAIDKLAVNLRRAGVNPVTTQRLVGVLNHTSYGSAVSFTGRGLQRTPRYGAVRRMPITSILGHALLVNGSEMMVVLPMGCRTALS